MGTSNFGPLFEASNYYALFDDTFPEHMSLDEHAANFTGLFSEALEGVADVYDIGKWEHQSYRDHNVDVYTLSGVEARVTLVSDPELEYPDSDVSIYIKFKVFLVPGYYEGATVDYAYEILGDDGNYYDTDLVDLKENMGDLGIELTDEQTEEAVKEVNRMIDLIIEKTENVLKESTTCLQTAARFSNGGTFYKECVHEG